MLEILAWAALAFGGLAQLGSICFAIARLRGPTQPSGLEGVTLIACLMAGWLNFEARNLAIWISIAVLLALMFIFGFVGQRRYPDADEQSTPITEQLSKPANADESDEPPIENEHQ